MAKQYHKNTKANFTPVPHETASALIDFASKRNVGKSVVIDGKRYRLEHLSESSDALFQSRGLSFYYRVDRSVVRISDHWSETSGHDKSRKFNCGLIASCWWIISGPTKPLFVSKYSGRFVRRMIAGKCALRNFSSYDTK